MPCGAGVFTRQLDADCEHPLIFVSGAAGYGS